MPRGMGKTRSVAVGAALEKIRHSEEMTKLKSLADRAATGSFVASFKGERFSSAGDKAEDVEHDEAADEIGRQAGLQASQ